MHLKTDTGAQAHFASVPTIRRPRNAFSISKKHVTTIQFDYLYPLFYKYIYPGDTLNIQQVVMARLQTQIKTLFDDLYVDMHAWFVPMRLIQTNWARYQFNAQPLGPTQDNSALTSPKITLSGLGAGGFTAKSLYDYFGFPTEVNLSADTEHINNYLGRAYNLIWNQNYRDENLQEDVVVDLDDGPDDPADYVLLKRGKRHDKFTSCLTAAQKGTAVSLPLGTSAPVYGPSITAGSNNRLIFQAWNTTDGATQWGALTKTAASSTANVATTGWTGTAVGDDVSSGHQLGTKAQYDAAGGSWSPPFADLSLATAATINQVRTSFAVQQLLEADARGGTRDVEAIAHRWGVQVPDFRLQRPEYLGGTTFTFDGHVVPQTSATSGANYQAGLAQFSQTMSAMPVTHSFVEHGIFMILVSCRSNISYQTSLKRELSYRTRYDWYQPEFANLGEVAVLNKEIFTSGTYATDNLTFGYQEYAYELRYDENMVTGEMRSNYATPLDSMHMATDYTATPTLNAAWIVSSTPISRNIAISAATADPIQINAITTGAIARTLPMYSIPGLRRL